MQPLAPITTAFQAADLPDNQRLALESLLSGHSRAEAASHAGVTECTLRRWLRDPLFHAALRQARCDAWTGITTRLQRLNEKALASLERVLDSESPRSQVYAAKTVLQLTIKALDLEALCGRAAQAEADLESYLQSEVEPHAEPEHEDRPDPSRGGSPAGAPPSSAPGYSAGDSPAAAGAASAPCTREPLGATLNVARGFPSPGGRERSGSFNAPAEQNRSFPILAGGRGHRSARAYDRLGARSYRVKEVRHV